MAREESDREDLLREATALVERVELTTAGCDPIVVGFRRSGAASFFFGAEPVVHFNPAGELRRAYVQGRLYKAESKRLIPMVRRRTDAETQLVRLDLSEEEASRLLTQLRQKLANLHDALSRGDYKVVGQVPPHADIVGRVRAWLAALPQSFSIAESPNVAGTARSITS